MTIHPTRSKAAPTGDDLMRDHIFEYRPEHRHSKMRASEQQGYIVADDEPRRTCVDTKESRFVLCSKITKLERDVLVKQGFSEGQFKDLRKPFTSLFSWMRLCLGRAQPLQYSGRLGQGSYARVKLAKRVPAQPPGGLKNPWRDSMPMTQTPEFYAVKAFGGAKTTALQWRDGLALMELEAQLLMTLCEHTPVEDQQFLATKDLQIARTLDSKNRKCMYAFMPLGLCNFDDIAFEHAREVEGAAKQQKTTRDSKFVKTTVYSLLRSLQNLHRLGIVHRDIKPANMMLTTQGRCVLIDLGLARYAQEPSVCQPKALSAPPVQQTNQAQESRGGAPISTLSTVKEERAVGFEHPPAASQKAEPTLPETGAAAFQALKREALKKQGQKASAGTGVAGKGRAALELTSHTSESNERTTQMTSRTGTLLYMAPELVSNKWQVALTYPKALDIWSLGASLLEMSHGGRAVLALMRSPSKVFPGTHAEEKGDALAESVVGLISLIKACLQPKPEDRPSVEALLNSPWLRDMSAQNIDWEDYKAQALEYQRRSQVQGW